MSRLARGGGACGVVCGASAACGHAGRRARQSRQGLGGGGRARSEGSGGPATRPSWARPPPPRPPTPHNRTSVKGRRTSFSTSSALLYVVALSLQLPARAEPAPLRARTGDGKAALTLRPARQPSLAVGSRARPLRLCHFRGERLAVHSLRPGSSRLAEERLDVQDEQEARASERLRGGRAERGEPGRARPASACSKRCATDVLILEPRSHELRASTERARAVGERDGEQARASGGAARLCAPHEIAHRTHFEAVRDSPSRKELLSRLEEGRLGRRVQLESRATSRHRRAVRAVRHAHRCPGTRCSSAAGALSEGARRSRCGRRAKWSRWTTSSRPPSASPHRLEPTMS